MTDTFSKAERSRVMAAVKSANTEPERAVRRLVQSLGYRVRLHAPELPGKPDIVLRRHRVVIFVHGCFWHGHGCRARRRHRPATNRVYWDAKLRRNKARDRRTIAALRRAGWRVMVAWECEVGTAALAGRMRRFLGRAAGGGEGGRRAEGGRGGTGERGKKGPRDQGTKGPRDQGTEGSRDQGIKGSRDQGTEGPRDRGSEGGD